MKTTLDKILTKATIKLSETSETPRLDAEILLSHLLKKPREYILTHFEIKLTESQITAYKSLVARRASSQPLAYILGHKEFYGLDFKVTENTLIPRPETELLVEEALKNIREVKYKIPATVIDVGTGSGNIIVSIALAIDNFKFQTCLAGRRVSNFKFIGLDISKKALRVARYNAKKNKVSDKIKFIKSNMLNCFIQNTKYKIPDTNLIIIANLPYLSKKNYCQAMSDVKKYEPRLALLAGKDGLDYYKKLFQQIKKLLVASCQLQVFLEFSPEQKNKIEKLILNYFPKTSIEFKKDLARKWRLASFKI